MSQQLFEVERINHIDDYYQTVDVQRRAWSMLGDTDVVPVHLLVTAQKNGGLVLGGFDAQTHQMVAYLFGFVGLTPDGHVKHCSHQLGVVPEWRSSGVGYHMKLQQRALVLQQGLDLVTWTYDPLEGANSYLNIAKLGAVCRTYYRNVYGEMRDNLNAGLPSDRFQVDWWIRNPYVEHRLTGGSQTGLADLQSAGATWIAQGELGEDRLLWPLPWKKESNAEVVLVMVPSQFQTIKQTHFELAMTWRLHTRALFEHYFAAGYTVVAFINGEKSGQPGNIYVLQRDFNSS
ncbi:MAG: hypothetical protein EXR62_01800 [Chloroflexi bacterium]|nr:hypothetical protein [Chloroflexota bacterium]